VGLTVATARRPRRLCDSTTAALGQPPRIRNRRRATNPLNGPIGSVITSADGQDACDEGRHRRRPRPPAAPRPVPHWTDLPIERIPPGDRQRDLPARDELTVRLPSLPEVSRISNGECSGSRGSRYPAVTIRPLSQRAFPPRATRGRGPCTGGSTAKLQSKAPRRTRAPGSRHGGVRHRPAEGQPQRRPQRYRGVPLATADPHARAAIEDLRRTDDPSDRYAMAAGRNNVVL